MEIKLLPACQVQRVEYKKQKPKQVSFGSSDEFIKTTLEKTFEDAKKEIQQKYQPMFSQLMSRQRTIAKEVRDKVNKEFYANFHEHYYNFMDKIYSSGPPGFADDKPQQNLKGILERFKDAYYTRNCDIPFVRIPNCIMITSKDKKLAEDVMEFTKFYTKVKNIQQYSMKDKEWLVGRCAFHRTCYETIKDTFGDDIGSFHDAILNAMEKAEERYKETGNPTVLHIENMERLIDKTKNESSDIAAMKDYMDKCGRYFYTMFTFTNTDPSKSDPGTMVSHRVGVQFDIDKLGIKRSNIDYYEVSDDFKNAVENASKIYKESSEEYISLRKQIKELGAEYKKEVEEAKKTFPKASDVIPPTQPAPPTPPAPTPGGGDDPNKFKELINKAIKKVKENKKTAIIIGAVAVALTATGIILHKKGKLKKQRVAMPQAQQPLKTAQFQNFMQGDSNVFKDFTLSNK